jgi:hypothetical protein
VRDSRTRSLARGLVDEDQSAYEAARLGCKYQVLGISGTYDEVDVSTGPTCYLPHLSR